MGGGFFSTASRFEPPCTDGRNGLEQIENVTAQFLVKGKHVWKTTLAVADHGRASTVVQRWLAKPPSARDRAADVKLQILGNYERATNGVDDGGKREQGHSDRQSRRRS
jgi:hypothetical protein